jgi:ssDNA-binding Zn-finger/Zn-ribbon topoisomerase 1
MAKVKMRKCPACSKQMTIKKGKAGKFWACTGYREGCTQTLEHFGDGAKTGLELEIREIENGYIIVTSHKYVESIDEDKTREIHCADKPALRATLVKLMAEEADFLSTKVEQVVEAGEFVDEASDDPDSPKGIKKFPPTKDIKELLRRVDTGRKAAATLTDDDEMVGD